MAGQRSSSVWIVVVAILASSCGGATTVADEPDVAPSAEIAPSTSTASEPNTTPTVIAANTATSPSPTETAALPPDWVPPSMSADQLGTFLNLVESELRPRGVDTTTLVDGYVEHEGAVFNFANLAGSVLNLPVGDWPTAVERHFAISLGEGLPEQVATWDEAASLVRLRLKGADELATLRPEVLVHDEIADGLFWVLAVDYPDVIGFATTSDLAAWGVSWDEAVAQARTNTRADPSFVETVETTFGEVDLLTGGFYTASDMLWLEDHLGEVTDAFLAVPVADVMLIVPVDDEFVTGSLTDLALAANGWFLDGPSSVSPGVYRWQAGDITRIEVMEVQPGVFAYPSGLIDSLQTD